MSGQNHYGLLMALDGNIYPLDDQLNRTGGFGPLNFTELKITRPAPDQKQRISMMRSSFGQALDSFSQPKPETISFTIDDCDPDILSMAMRGTPANYSQTAATAQTVTLTAHLDLWVAIGHNNLTAFAITGSTSGTDYKVDMEAGLFMALSGGNITEGASVTATASWSARTGKSIVSGTVPKL